MTVKQVSMHFLFYNANVIMNMTVFVQLNIIYIDLQVQLRVVILVAFSVFATSDIVSGFNQRAERHVNKRAAMHFCGSSLTDALELVCQYRMGKRSQFGE